MKWPSAHTVTPNLGRSLSKCITKYFTATNSAIYDVFLIVSVQVLKITQVSAKPRTACRLIYCSTETIRS